MLNAIIVIILDNEKVVFESVGCARTYLVFQRVVFWKKGVLTVLTLKTKMKKL